MAPSAVCTIEMASFMLRMPWLAPLIWLLSELATLRPAASSRARLMRRPEDRRSTEVAREFWAPSRFFWATCEAMLV
jgi:hypothetical protein